MNQKLFITQHQCLMPEKKCETIPELQAALDSSRAEVHRLDDCIAKFRSAMRCRAYFVLAVYFEIQMKSCDNDLTQISGVERTGAMPNAAKRSRAAVESCAFGP
jgi:hypothetical protein